MLSKKQKCIWWLWLSAALIWMLVIFLKSAQPYAEQDMRPFLASIISQSWIDQWLPHIEFTYDHGIVTWKKPYDLIEFFIRKGAHVTEYAILCFLWIRVWRAQSISWMKSIGFAAVISVAYASSDEWHQSFIVGRTGHPIDVMVDSIGIVLISIVCSIFYKLVKRSK